jgi:ABC-2 type transport system ATP-binding protein
MLQRVGIAQSLVNDPKVLFFDEPTSGLDPIAHRDIRDLIIHLKNEGRTLFLSSHQLSDVEEVCDRVSILYRGKIRKIGRVEDLIAGGKVEVIADGIKLTPAISAELKANSDSIVENQNGHIVITGSADNATKQTLIDIIRKNDGSVVSVAPTRRTLEDIFIETIRDGETEAGEAINLNATVK